MPPKSLGLGLLTLWSLTFNAIAFQIWDTRKKEQKWTSNSNTPESSVKVHSTSGTEVKET